MKRDSRGAPVVTVYQWNRPTSSCRWCREKKQRCDRGQPCSNCTIRNIQCEYGSENQPTKLVKESATIQVPPTSTSPNEAVSKLSKLSTARPELASLNAEETLYRIRNLEEAVFGKRNQALTSASMTWPQPEYGAAEKDSSASINSTLFGCHLLPDSRSEPSIDIAYAARKLPPIEQARELFSHFILLVQPSFGIFHIPSSRALMEQTYQEMLESKEPSVTNLLLLFSIFASAALLWTPQLLEKLKSTRIESKAAVKVYIHLAMSIIHNDHQPINPSTIALAAISNMALLLGRSNGLTNEVNILQMRCLVMARTMGVYRLDTAKCLEERRLKGCNMIEIEVQRRVWWNMVSSDWLNAFSGGSQEGIYIFQPNHMNVNYPSNVDDEFITPKRVEHNVPLSIPTTMSAFIYRIKLADLCREVVDAMPSTLIESTNPEYNVVLALDDKFQDFLKQLPYFFRLDPTSIQQSEEVCKKLPNLAWQRIGINFSLYTRLCRLHRPYHLEGVTNSKYTYSHTTCVRSAQTVLDLRRSLDDACAKVGVRPSRSWIVMEHVFLAALILATDVSFNPNAPDAEARKAEVLNAYCTLEKSKEESSSLVETIQRNMQALMSALHKRQPQMPSSQAERSTDMRSEPYIAPNRIVSDSDEILVNMQASPNINTVSAGGGAQNSGVVPGEENWDQLWSDFLAVAPELDVPQWNLLLDDTGFQL